MNAKKILAAIGLLSLSLTAMAGDIDTVVVKGNPGASRAAVKAELTRAIANGDIVHGDLVDFQQLVVSPRPERMLASSAAQNERAAQANKPQVVAGQSGTTR